MTSTPENDRPVSPYGAVQTRGEAIERRVARAMNHEDDVLNNEPAVVSARERLREARSTPGPTKILNVVAADGGVRQAIREIIVTRIVEVAG